MKIGWKDNLKALGILFAVFGLAAACDGLNHKVQTEHIKKHEGKPLLCTQFNDLPDAYITKWHLRGRHVIDEITHLEYFVGNCHHR